MFHSLKRLMPYFRPFRTHIVVMLLFGLAVTIINGMVPVLSQLLLDIFNRSNFESFCKVIPAWVFVKYPLTPELHNEIARIVPYLFPILFLLLGLSRFIHAVLINWISERVIALIRRDLVAKILRLNLSYLGSFERGSGGLISRVFNDPLLLQQGLNFYVDLIREPIQALIYLAYMIFLDWKLSLFSLLFLPLFVGIMRKVGKSLRKYGAESRDSMDDLTSVFKDAVDGARVVQSFNLQTEMLKRFEERLGRYLRTAYKIIRREQAVSPANEFLVSFLVMGFAIYSIDQVLGGDPNTTRFVAFIVAAGFLQAPIKKLQDAGVKIQQSVVVTDRIFDILENGKEVPQDPNAVPFPVNWKTIRYENVSFNYGAAGVLKNVNLTVKRGEVIGLVGESGSGKSTLVNLLERFYDPTEGRILIDEIPITKMKLQDLRKHIALVTQDVFLFNDTIATNIHAGDFEKPATDVERSANLANAHGFISATPKGYQSPVGERGNFLSGGEKQRVSIARAMFKDAPVLILDEATSALDSVSEQKVQQGLDHLMEGRTAFVIAHRLSTIFGADRILVMKNGEIVEQGTHDELLGARGAYHALYEMQMNRENRLNA